jgi:peptidoglycan-associated lipoprotein
MRIRISVLLLALSCLVLPPLGGCKKKQPATAPDVAQPADIAPDPGPVSAAPAPVPAPAPDPDPLAGDIDSVNEYLLGRGLLGDAYFEYDRTDLSPEVRDRLARNARFLKEHPQFLVTIEGHCDERGTGEYNLALGERRAASVRDYLVSLGVPANRLSILSYGKERPVCEDPDEGCWRRNRRGHHRVTGRSGN